MQKISEQIIKKLISLNLTIATCESMTGGLLANKLVEVEHASNVFLGGFVSYSKKSKINIVGVDEEIVNKYGTISQECANEMAKKTQIKFDSNIAISITGNASLKNPDEGKKTGIAYITIFIFDKKYDFFYQKQFATNRNEIQYECVLFVLNNFWSIIKQYKK
ncbi:nicotinamide-nucleotide amidohydrolase family protein [bacterium]|nr:nicotinamide-nucleotide amidohydrolase family protein [bacterium]